MTGYLLYLDPVASSMEKQIGSISGPTRRIRVPKPATAESYEASVPQLSLASTTSPVSPQYLPSKRIPLPSSHVHRTQSELQLCEDMEVAERKDATMFNRLVNGIRGRQMNLDQSNNESPSVYARNSLHVESERSIANIINTRNTPLDETPIRTLENFRPVMPQGSHGFNSHGLQRDRVGYVEDWSVCGFDQPQLSLVGGVEASLPGYGPQSYHANLYPIPGLDEDATNNQYPPDNGEEEIFHLDM